MNDYVKNEINNNIDLKYRDFSKKLLPSVKNIRGVRIPVLRRIAKNVNDSINFLENVSNESFEETMIEGFVIGNLKDKDIVIKYIDRFLSKIDNWSICDSFCASLKIVNKNKDYFFDYICNYKDSKKEYYLRFMLVMFLNYYIELKYLEKMFEIIDNIKKEDYYVKMAIAWFLSMCYIKYPSETLEYLEEAKLDNFTYNKSIQKMIESKKIDVKTKNELKKLKR